MPCCKPATTGWWPAAISSAPFRPRTKTTRRRSICSSMRSAGVADAETEYFLNRARYALATKNVHFVKGTLLEYDGVFLAEGPWPGEAYDDAAKREASRSMPRAAELRVVASAGRQPRAVFDQQLGESAPLQRVAGPCRRLEEPPLDIREMAPPSGRTAAADADRSTSHAGTPDTPAAAASDRLGPTTPSAASSATAIADVQYVATRC